MLILIEKDSATSVPREVTDDAEAQAYVDRGFVVHRVLADGSKVPFTTQPEVDAESASTAPAKKAAAKKTPAKR